MDHLIKVENPTVGSPKGRRSINCSAVRAHVCYMQRHVLIIWTPVYNASPPADDESIVLLGYIGGG